MCSYEQAFWILNQSMIYKTLSECDLHFPFILFSFVNLTTLLHVWNSARTFQSLCYFKINMVCVFSLRIPIPLCKFQQKNYQYVLAFIFAIEEINRNPHLLPNMSLGFDLYNAVHSEHRTLESSLIWLSGLDRDIPNYTCRRESKVCFLPILFLTLIPNFDNDQFPSLYQMAPRDTSLALGMISLLLHFSWTWVGLVISEDKKGVQVLSDLRGEMDRSRICAAFVEMIPVSDRTYFSMTWQYHLWIKESSAKVVIVYGDSDSLISLSFSKWHLLVIWKVWVTTSQWDFTIPGFEKFIMTANPSKYPEDFYLAKLWFISFNCMVSESDCKILEKCPLNASLGWLPWHRFDMAMTEGSNNVYNAVYAVAWTLHEMLLQQVEMQTMGKHKSFCLHPFLGNIQFNNPAGDSMNLAEGRRSEAENAILNFWNFPEGLGLKVKVGKYSPHAPRGQELSLSEEMIEWAIGVSDLLQTPHSVWSESCSPGFRKTTQEGKATCCFDCAPCPENEISNETDMDQCVRCLDHQYANRERDQCLQKAVTFLAYEDPLGTALACTALSFSGLTAVVLGVFVKHRDTLTVKVNNRTLSYILLVSLTLCFLCSLLFISRPNTATCILQQIAFGVLFTVAVSAILAKTLTVLVAFKVTAPGRRMRQWSVSGAPNFIIPVCSFIQLSLHGVWLGTCPPFIDMVAHSEQGHVIIVCNKGSVTAFYCVLGYLGSLALGSFSLAYLARNLPDTFNEAKFLTFSVLVFCSVWVPFLPVYRSTKGKVMVAVEIFSISASSAGLLGCIFVPKCYIIFLRPERNTSNVLRNTTHLGK
uniref:G-protein coupled receptors family 3 profile domain-containing protein n=1 Tax=Equus asinus TaxID=9793 RepID=A0A9L0I5C1_EQUAS